jgi:hypothetical protein
LSDYSRGMARSRRGISGASALRAGLAAGAALGALCLVAAKFATVIEIKVGAGSRLVDSDTQLSGWDRHGPALVLIALFALAMIAGALRGARPAMAAVTALGLAALLIAVIGDVPDLDETGFIGQAYEDAAAGPAAGFYLETLGGMLLLACGGLMLAAGHGQPQRSARAATAVSGLSENSPSTPRS